MVLGPQPDLVAATAEDRDVERVDRRLEQDLGLAVEACADVGGHVEESRPRADRSRGSRRWSVQSPPRSTLLGMSGRGVIEPEGSAAAGELEGGDVVLDAVVIAGEGRRAKQVDGPVRADEAAAAECGRGGDEQCGGRRQRAGAMDVASSRLLRVRAFGSMLRSVVRAGRPSVWIGSVRPDAPARSPPRGPERSGPAAGAMRSSPRAAERRGMPPWRSRCRPARRRRSGRR